MACVAGTGGWRSQATLRETIAEHSWCPPSFFPSSPYRHFERERECFWERASGPTGIGNKDRKFCSPVDSVSAKITKLPIDKHKREGRGWGGDRREQRLDQNGICEENVYKYIPGPTQWPWRVLTFLHVPKPIQSGLWPQSWDRYPQLSLQPGPITTVKQNINSPLITWCHSFFLLYRLKIKSQEKE